MKLREADGIVEILHDERQIVNGERDGGAQQQ